MSVFYNSCLVNCKVRAEKNILSFRRFRRVLERGTGKERTEGSTSSSTNRACEGEKGGWH